MDDSFRHYRICDSDARRAFALQPFGHPTASKEIGIRTKRASVASRRKVIAPLHIQVPINPVPPTLMHKSLLQQTVLLLCLGRLRSGSDSRKRVCADHFPDSILNDAD